MGNRSIGKSSAGMLYPWSLRLQVFWFLSCTCDWLWLVHNLYSPYDDSVMEQWLINDNLNDFLAFEAFAAFASKFVVKLKTKLS